MVYDSPPNPGDPLSQPPSPGGFPPDAGPYGYQGTPTPIGYQNPTQFGQPQYGNRQMWSTTGQGLGGGLGRALLSFTLGPGSLRRGGRRRYIWYLRIAFWLIAIGVGLYFGLVKHMWVSTCTGSCGD